MTKSKIKPQYNEEDINALEYVSMLIDEYMCCDDSELTESGKQLKELVELFFYQWKITVENFELTENKKMTSMDFVKTLEEAHKATKGSKMVFK